MNGHFVTGSFHLFSGLFPDSLKYSCFHGLSLYWVVCLFSVPGRKKQGQEQILREAIFQAKEFSFAPRIELSTH